MQLYQSQKRYLPVDDEPAIRIGEFAHDDDDQIDQRPDTAASQRNELQNARSDLADIETVDTERSCEEAEQQRDDPLFGTLVTEGFTHGFLGQSTAALDTYDGIFIDLSAAIGTEHGLNLFMDGFRSIGL